MPTEPVSLRLLRDDAYPAVDALLPNRQVETGPSRRHAKHPPGACTLYAVKRCFWLCQTASRWAPSLSLPWPLTRQATCCPGFATHGPPDGQLPLNQLNPTHPGYPPVARPVQFCHGPNTTQSIPWQQQYGRGLLRCHSLCVCVVCATLVFVPDAQTLCSPSLLPFTPTPSSHPCRALSPLSLKTVSLHEIAHTAVHHRTHDRSGDAVCPMTDLRCRVGIPALHTIAKTRGGCGRLSLCDTPGDCGRQPVTNVRQRGQPPRTSATYRRPTLLQPSLPNVVVRSSRQAGLGAGRQWRRHADIRPQTTQSTDHTDHGHAWALLWHTHHTLLYRWAACSSRAIAAGTECRIAMSQAPCGPVDMLLSRLWNAMVVISLASRISSRPWRACPSVECRREPWAGTEERKTKKGQREIPVGQSVSQSFCVH